jgi:acyl-CoA synthetase (AMP-forming)/AMP-acid ligase II
MLPLCNVTRATLHNRKDQVSNVARRHLINELAAKIRENVSFQAPKNLLCCVGVHSLDHHSHHLRAMFSKLFSALRCSVSASAWAASFSALRFARIDAIGQQLASFKCPFARLSDDGYYTLLGRKSDLIISGLSSRRIPEVDVICDRPAD